MGKGDYTLATGAAALSGQTVLLGTTALTVGAEDFVPSGTDYQYKLALSGEGALVLSVKEQEAQKPATVYVDSAWTTEGEIIKISESVEVKVGTNGFQDYQTAKEKVADGGTIVIHGGEIAFADMTMKTVVDTGATITGKATFTAETPITVAGTFRFDTSLATETEPQLVGYKFIDGNASFELVDSTKAVVADERTLVLASDAETFNKTISIVGSDKSLAIGQEAVRVGGYDYAIGFQDSNLVLSIVKFVPSESYEAVYVNSTWTGPARTIRTARRSRFLAAKPRWAPMRSPITLRQFRRLATRTASKSPAA